MDKDLTMGSPLSVQHLGPHAYPQKARAEQPCSQHGLVWNRPSLQMMEFDLSKANSGKDHVTLQVC